MRTIKILTVLILALGVITFSSCKKDKKVTPSATITADVNGTATSFNTNALAVKGTEGDTQITAVQGDGPNGTHLAITINGTVTAGTTYSATGNNEPILLYSNTDDNFLNDDSSTTNAVSVTITSVSSTSIQGTFKGDVTNTVINPDNHAAISKSITNGKFSVSF